MNKKSISFWVTLALIGSSIEPIIVKIGQNNQIPSFQLLVLKLFCGGLFFSPFYRKLKIPSVHLLKQFFFIALLATGTNYCVFLALENLSVPVVITLISTTPAFVGLLNYFQGRVILGKKFWFGFVFVFLGILLSIDLTSLSVSSVSFIGLLFATLAIFGSTMYRTNVEKLCEKVDPFQISIFIFLVNGGVSFALLPLIGQVQVETWPIVIWLALAGVVANIAFIKAIQILGSTQTSIISLLQRPLVIIAASFIFKTPLTILQMTGIFYVVVGVAFCKAEKKLVPTIYRVK